MANTPEVKLDFNPFAALAGYDKAARERFAEHKRDVRKVLGCSTFLVYGQERPDECYFCHFGPDKSRLHTICFDQNQDSVVAVVCTECRGFLKKRLAEAKCLRCGRVMPTTRHIQFCDDCIYQWRSGAAA